MSKPNPILVIALLAAIALVAYIKLSNPHRKFSTEEYWENATTEMVTSVPDDALKPGNKNGGVLMWAAMINSDPEVIKALVARGADINEHDPIFDGTPLSAAASSNRHPEIIDTLVSLGANVHQIVGFQKKTALILAAELTVNPEVIKRLVAHGADLNYKDIHKRNALQTAQYFKNEPAEKVIKQLLEDEQ